MSYDIWLTADLGGPEPLTIGDWNYTSNCAAMWRAAGADLAEFHGKSAAECITPLHDAIVDMRTKPAKYQVMNPPNGWGSYDNLLPALDQLRELLRSAPQATVVISR